MFKKNQDIASLVNDFILALKQKESCQEQIVSKVLKELVHRKDDVPAEEIRLNRLKGGNKLSVKLGRRKCEDIGVVDALTAVKVKK